MPPARASCFVVAAVALAGLSAALVLLYSQHLALLAELDRLQGAPRGGSPGDLAALRAKCDDAFAAVGALREENTLLRTAAVQLERLAAEPAAACDGAARQPAADADACEARTLYIPPGEALSEAHFARDFLVGRYGWREASDSSIAAVVLATGDAPPTKRLCGEGFEGARVPGTFGRELEVCQKHKLFARLADYAAHGAQTPDAIAERWPWLPKTYLLDRPQHAAALNATLPCAGPQRSYFVKGDAHGGRAVWFPETYEELRKLVGRACGAGGSGSAAASAQTASEMDSPPRLVQELVESVLWDGASVMIRVFMVALRRGRTRFSAERGRWSLGLPPPAYELHVYDAPLVTQYPGKVRDSASEEMVIRRNASEFEAFVQAELARRGAPKQRDWFSSYFMKEVHSIAAASFAASASLWPWDLPPMVQSADATDSLKAGALEPDGAFMFISQELLVDQELRARLIEYTCVPADIHGLQAQFDKLPWTRAFAEDLGASLALLLLHGAGQPLGESRPDVAGARGASLSRWTLVAQRGPFPHP